jgi:hypothetical protein
VRSITAAMGATNARLDRGASEVIALRGMVDEVLGQVADHASVLRDVQLGVSVGSQDVAILVRKTGWLSSTRA